MGNLKEKLMDVQSELKAPKGQYNSFGKYKYRSCEDVLEALKPLLKKNGLILTISDDIKLVGERYYIQANVCLTDTETGDNMHTFAYAREEESKKGMDGSQVTAKSFAGSRHSLISNSASSPTGHTLINPPASFLTR